MADVKIGTITHYYGHIGVGVVKLAEDMSVGDQIKIKGNKTDFTQTVSSMQLDHQAVEKVKKGAEIGLKVDQAVRPGDIVFKV